MANTFNEETGQIETVGSQNEPNHIAQAIDRTMEEYEEAKGLAATTAIQEGRDSMLNEAKQEILDKIEGGQVEVNGVSYSEHAVRAAQKAVEELTPDPNEWFKPEVVAVRQRVRAETQEKIDKAVDELEAIVSAQSPEELESTLLYLQNNHNVKLSGLQKISQACFAKEAGELVHSLGLANTFASKQEPAEDKIQRLAARGGVSKIQAGLLGE